MTRSYTAALEPFFRVLAPLFENKALRDQARSTLENAAARSPIQDVLNREEALRMGSRSLESVIEPENLDVLRRTPRPEFGPGSATRQPQAIFQDEAPVPQVRPTGATPTYTVRRGDPSPAVRQDVPPAPRAAERFETENQLRIPYTQPGKGGQMYSPAKSSESADVVADSMQKTVGDVLDAGAFLRSRLGVDMDPSDVFSYRVAEGQRALDLDPAGTRQMMSQMSPDRMVAPRVADPMRPAGVQVTDLSGINPRDLAILAGAGTAGVALGSLGDNKKPAEESSADGAMSLTAEESAALNEYMSNILTSAGQNPGALNDVIRRNAPRSPETYQNPYEYQQDVARFIAGLQSGEYRDIAAAFEVEQSGAILDPEAPGIREQTNEQVTTGSVGSALGNANTENAVGQAEAAGANARIAGMGGTLEGAAEAQKNNEIIDATRPIVTSELSRVQDFMREQADILNSQAEIQRRIKADSEAAMRAGMSPMAQRIRFEGDIRDRDIQARASFDSRFDRR